VSDNHSAAAPAAQAEAGMMGQRGISGRSVLIGALLALAINALDAYATIMIRGSYLTLNFSTPAAIFFFFLLFLANLMVRWLGRTLALERTELIVIYFMMIVACCIPSMGFTLFIIPSLVGSFYYASPENNWAQLYNQYIPTWMVPQGDEVRRYFFEGLPAGSPLPWGTWAVPLAYWYTFFLALSLVMISSMVILRRQWVEREKLVYPLVQVPMQLIQEDGAQGRPLLASKLLWVGFACASLLLCANALHDYYPFLPKIERSISLPLFRDSVQLGFFLSPSWIGFIYFVNLEVSASIWVFYTLTTIQRGAFNFLGVQSNERMDLYSREPYLAHQGMGAMIVFAVIGIWMARGHLREVFARAFKGKGADDAGEMMSYRLAVAGLLGGLLAVGTGLWAAGLPPLLALMFLFGAMVLFLGLTRAVAEGGLPAMRPPIMTSSFLISGVGSSEVGIPGMIALGFSYGWHSEIRSFVMSSVANGLKMSELVQGSRRPLFWVVVLAILVGLAGSTYMTLLLSYKYGGINLNPLFYGWGAATYGPTDMAPRLADAPTGPRWDAWFFIGLGGLVMGFLMWVRHRFLWWPLSPLGYTISANWMTGAIFGSAFAAWLFKALILKYGGPRLYRNLRPFFLGLILGEIVTAGTWLCIDYLTGHTDSFLGEM